MERRNVPMLTITPKDVAKIASQSFVLPDICIRIRAMLDNDNSSLEEIGELIALDPSLSSKLLKLANSSLFRFESQVDTLTKAISVIGGEALYNLVMAETASSAFEHFSSDVIDLKRFWLQSVYAGLVAKHLAKIARIRGSERFFVLGLLHNIGELLVAVQAPELVIKCNQYDAKICPWHKQQELMGFDFAKCSAELMQVWRLPSQLYLPIEHIHDEIKALKDKEIAVIFCAARAGIALANQHLYTPHQLVPPTVISALNLENYDLNAAVKYALMEADNIITLMQPKAK
ncbi:HDOD domain-containing protein [Paraglaciecola sp.]|uniref:HDOD domain-containing protein n=1 Tax=Paraglaciecola sp. TaxID=1920173 RepID=UPI00273FD2B5|nr:HDOD domain-containing protein [Paraglaciecola sp.]